MKSLKALLESLAQSSRLTVREKTHTTLRTRGGKLNAKTKGNNSSITQYQNNGGTINVNNGSQSNDYAARYERLQELRAKKLYTGYDEDDQKEMDGLKRWLETHSNY